VGFIYRLNKPWAGFGTVRSVTTSAGVSIEASKSTTANYELAMFGEPVNAQFRRSSGGTADFKCTLMSTVCELVPVTGRDAVTYLKDEIKIA
jgi:hypothetical protein